MRLFLSYSGTQINLAQPLYESLKRRHYEIFFDASDRDGLTPARQFTEQLRAEILGSDVFCILWSPEWLASAWCKAEFEVAQRIDLPIVMLVPPEPTCLPKREYRRNR
jgi:hypothetical protein